jgi:hypothetical protein
MAPAFTLGVAHPDKAPGIPILKAAAIAPTF